MPKIERVVFTKIILRCECGRTHDLTDELSSEPAYKSGPLKISAVPQPRLKPRRRCYFKAVPSLDVEQFIDQAKKTLPSCTYTTKHDAVLRKAAICIKTGTPYEHTMSRAEAQIASKSATALGYCRKVRKHQATLVRLERSSV